MKPWYRAYVGTCADEKIAEAALVGGVSRCVVIAVWHAILESASYEEAGGAFTATPRRAAATLCEPLSVIEAAFAALTEVGMIADGTVVAWRRRQFDSDSPGASTTRVQTYRARQRHGRAEPSGAEPSLPLGSPAEAPRGGETACNGDETLCNGEPAFQGADVTPPESETETDSSPSSRGSAPANARTRPPPDSLERRARELMGTLPVVIDPDFGPIRRLIEEGLTEADALAGMAAALEARDFRPRSWAKLEGWVRRAAKDRIAAAAIAPGEDGRRPREGPGGFAPRPKVTDFRMAALRRLHADAKARERGDEGVQFA
jgi:hypothetical protein